MLHYDSRVEIKYKKSLVLTMLDRAFRLSSSWKIFTEECERLKKTFVRLRYPTSLLDNIIRATLLKKAGATIIKPKKETSRMKT